MAKWLIIVLLLAAIVYVAKPDKKAIVRKEVPPIEEIITPKKEIPKKEIEVIPLPKKLPSKKVQTYAQALVVAKAYKQPIFIYFGAEWCAYCKIMKSQTLADTEVKNKLDNDFIVLILDSDENRSLAQKFRVAGIPSYIIINDDESIVSQDSGFKRKQEFLDWIKPKNTSKID